MATVRPVDDPDDPRVADFVGLNDADLRRRREQGDPNDAGFFVAEGALVIHQLLRSPYPVRSFLVSERGLRALDGLLDDLAAPVYLAPQAVLEKICGFNFHRGSLASAGRLPLPGLASTTAGADLVVLVEGVNDHENLGALFRNAAAFGAGAVVLDPTCADPLYRRSIRVSMGHVLRLSFTRATAWPATIGDLRASGFEVIALTPSPEAEDVRGIEPAPGAVPTRRALLVGAEGPGLSAPALAAADRRVRIAMAAGVDSLNVATAAAIALHRLSSPDG